VYAQRCQGIIVEEEADRLCGSGWERNHGSGGDGTVWQCRV